MTAQSGRGQGDEPLYEGVVLPANGEPWTPEQQRQVAQSHSQPPAGQPWGQPWGPESRAAVTSSTESSAALPPPPPHAPPTPPAQPPAAQPHQPLPGSTEYAGAASVGRHRGGPTSHGGTPALGQSPGGLPGAAGHSQAYAPAAPGPYDAQGLYADAQLPPQQPYAQPQPHTAGALHGSGQPFAEADATQMLPPQQGPFPQPYAGVQPSPAAPLTASDATQYIPPVPGAPQQGQPLPGHMPPVDADATQMLPPQVAPGQDSESTTTLRSPLPPESRGGTAAPYATGQAGHAQEQRQTPAEFDSLFRAEPSQGAGGGATQSLPLFDQAAARQRANGVGGLGSRPPQAGPAGPPAPATSTGQGGRAARRNAERGGASRMSPAVLIGIGVVVVAAVGMAAGAALSGGDEGGEAKGGSSAQPDEEKKAPAGPDPVKAQAQDLDKLLADSNNSRTAVIRSVENIKACQKLGQAASDLRAAAGQRNGLVKRLGELETDKIPANAKLKTALTRAWKSSAAADNHYATWADQTARKKGCRKGKAKVTAHTGAGTRSSGEATTAKKEAAGLWNPTAQQYGLKERQFGQL